MQLMDLARAADPTAKQVVLLNRAVFKRFLAIARDVVIADGGVELAHCEVDALALDLIVKVPSFVDLGFQNLPAEFIVNHQRRYPALP
jgi:hypothetical protein